MTSEQITDFEVEERTRTEVYCDSCGATVEDPDDAATLVANPFVDGEEPSFRHPHRANSQWEFNDRMFLERAPPDITAEVVMEDICPSCLDGLTDGERKIGTVTSNGVDTSDFDTARVERRRNRDLKQRHAKAMNMVALVLVAANIVDMLGVPPSK